MLCVGVGLVDLNILQAKDLVAKDRNGKVKCMSVWNACEFGSHLVVFFYVWHDRM